MPISALIISEPMNGTFEADALINGKNYTIKAYGSREQRVISMNTHKLLKKICGNFTDKLMTLLKEKMPKPILKPLPKYRK